MQLRELYVHNYYGEIGDSEVEHSTGASDYL